MKRWMALLLAAVLCFSLAACSGDKGGEAKEKDNGPMTKEELSEAAEEKSFPDLDTTNKAKLETYVGEVYKISGYINSIESDYLVLQEEGLPKKRARRSKPLSSAFMSIWIQKHWPGFRNGTKSQLSEKSRIREQRRWSPSQQLTIDCILIWEMPISHKTKERRLV